MKKFTIKDSGEREEFASGMVRDTTAGKILWHLINSGPMLKRWAEHLTKGAAKYTANNWMKASGEAEYNRFKESAFRHFMQWYRDDRDEDHGAAVYFNINGAEYVQEKLEANDLSARLEESIRQAQETKLRKLIGETGPGDLTAGAGAPRLSEVPTSYPFGIGRTED